MSLKDLSDFVQAEKRKEYPNIPSHAFPRKSFSDKTANELQTAILAWFDLNHIKAWRQRSEGRFIQGESVTNVIGQSIQVKKGKFIPTGKHGGKGAGDIQATLPPMGRSLHIEVKIGTDRQRESQKKFQEEHESSGGLYIIVRSWDDFITKMKNYESQRVLVV